VLREGNVLHLPARTLEVVEACSGIRSLVSLVMLGIVLGDFTEPRLPARVVLACAAVPIAILANAARVAGTGLAAELDRAGGRGRLLSHILGMADVRTGAGQLSVGERIDGRSGAHTPDRAPARRPRPAR